MHVYSWSIRSSAVLLLILGNVAAADPWISSVKPRLIGRGETTEISLRHWAISFFQNSLFSAVVSL